MGKEEGTARPALGSWVPKQGDFDWGELVLKRREFACLWIVPAVLVFLGERMGSVFHEFEFVGSLLETLPTSTDPETEEPSGWERAWQLS